MPFTLRNAIDQTLTRVTQTSGADVQTYGDLILKEMIWSRFVALFEKFWWPQFYEQGESFALDGTTGQVGVDLSSKIREYQDVRYVWYKDYNNPLPMAHNRDNVGQVKRTAFQFVKDRTKVLRILPVSSVGNVTIAYRTRPAKFELDTDIIDMDDQLIIFGAAYDFLNEIGINPGAEDKLARTYEQRYQDVTKGLEKYEIGSESTTNLSINGWQELNDYGG